MKTKFDRLRKVSEKDVVLVADSKRLPADEGIAAELTRRLIERCREIKQALLGGYHEYSQEACKCDVC